MGAYGNTTTGTASTILSWIRGAGGRVQVLRKHRASAVAAPTAWTVTVAGSASVLAAATSGDRTSILIYNDSNTRIKIRFDATIPTGATAFTMALDSKQWYNVDEEWIDCAISLAGEAGGGTVYITVGSDT